MTCPCPKLYMNGRIILNIHADNMVGKKQTHRQRAIVSDSRVVLDVPRWIENHRPEKINGT